MNIKQKTPCIKQVKYFIPGQFYFKTKLLQLILQ